MWGFFFLLTFFHIGSCTKYNSSGIKTWEVSKVVEISFSARNTHMETVSGGKIIAWNTRTTTCRACFPLPGSDFYSGETTWCRRTSGTRFGLGKSNKQWCDSVQWTKFMWWRRGIFFPPKKKHLQKEKKTCLGQNARYDCHSWKVTTAEGRLSDFPSAICAKLETCLRVGFKQSSLWAARLTDEVRGSSRDLLPQ